MTALSRRFCCRWLAGLLIFDMSDLYREMVVPSKSRGIAPFLPNRGVALFARYFPVPLP
jgi:hypothetical protein